MRQTPKYFQYGLKFLQYLHWLNLDIILGAIGLSLWFQLGFHCSFDLASLIALGAAIGFIYTLDHLWDVKSVDLIEFKQLSDEKKSQNQEFCTPKWRLMLRIVLIILKY